MANEDSKKMYLLEILNGKWRILIIEGLSSGTKQFKDLKSGIEGISSKSLDNNLQFLVKSGIVNRKKYPTFPCRVEYSLSDTGNKVIPMLDIIYDWSIKNYQPFKEEIIDGYSKIFEG